MRKIFGYIRPYLGYICLTLFIKLCATCVELTIPSLMEIILDDKVPAGDRQQIVLFGGLMLLCAAVAMGGNILANRMSAISAGKITRKLRHDLFAKLQGLSARQMDQLTTASAISRLTSDTYNVNQLLARLQRIGVRAPIMLIGGIIMMLTMDVVLALVLIALLPFLCICIVLVTRKTVPLFSQSQDVQDDIVQVCQENITGIRVVKALSKTEYERQRFDGVNTEHTAISQKAGITTNISSPITTFILNLGLTLVLIVGAFRVNRGDCQPGVIVAFLQYFTTISIATATITRVFIMWSRGEASAKRIAEVLDEPEDLQVLPGEDTPPAENSAHIEFENVTFSYTGVGTNLENLSFRLEHGQTLGILGPTGCGKSTILKLLLRIYDVDSGRILIDGKDIRTIPAEVLRAKFGVVFQNDFIAEGTLAENIGFFRDLSDERIHDAAQDAQALPFIMEREGEMDGEVAVRGNNLSGGQKQRLLIARALAGDPEILLLDDSSSALDYQTDANLRKALRENYRNTTTLLVAQRVSSMRHADLILVLHEGQVIGAGTHDTLMDTGEEYRIIAETQMGDGREAM